MMLRRCWETRLRRSKRNYIPFVRELRDRVSRILKMAPDWKNLQRL